MRWVFVSGILGIAIILASSMMWFGHERFQSSANELASTNESSSANDLAGLTPAAGSGKASIGGDFTLTDQNGNIVHSADLKGKFVLIAFGFTFCPDVCPTTLSTMTQALNTIGDLSNMVQPVFVSVDPERDTPAVLKAYASGFHPRLLALSGTQEQTREVTDAYKVYYQSHKESPTDTNYLVDHSSFIYLMGPNGEYITHFAYSTPASEMSVRLTEILQGDNAY